MCGASVCRQTQTQNRLLTNVVDGYFSALRSSCMAAMLAKTKYSAHFPRPLLLYLVAFIFLTCVCVCGSNFESCTSARAAPSTAYRYQVVLYLSSRLRTLHKACDEPLFVRPHNKTLASSLSFESRWTPKGNSFSEDNFVQTFRTFLV